MYTCVSKFHDFNWTFRSFPDWKRLKKSKAESESQSNFRKNASFLVRRFELSKGQKAKVKGQKVRLLQVVGEETKVKRQEIRAYAKQRKS